MKTVSVREARAHFSDILNEVHFGKKQIIITRSGKPFVTLTIAKPRETKKQQNGKTYYSS